MQKETLKKKKKKQDVWGLKLRTENWTNNIGLIIVDI